MHMYILFQSSQCCIESTTDCHGDADNQEDNKSAGDKEEGGNGDDYDDNDIGYDNDRDDDDKGHGDDEADADFDYDCAEDDDDANFE